MSNNQSIIDKFYTPANSTNKRVRGSSPTDLSSGNIEETVVNMKTSDLVPIIERMGDKKIEKIVTKDDMKELNERIYNLENENSHLKQQLYDQKVINAKLNSRLESLENINKMRNIIIKGLKITNDVENSVTQILLKIILHFKIPTKYVVLTKKKTKKKEAMDLATFKTAEDTHAIFRNIKTLKDSRISW